MKSFRWLYVLPTIIVILLVIIGPLLYAFYMSFNEWHMINPRSVPTFNFIKNYINLFKDARFINSLLVTLKLLVLTLPVELVLGLIIAMALTNISRGRGIITSIILIPTMLSPIAVGIIWLMLFSTNFGPINFFIRHLGGEAIAWIASSPWSLIAVAVSDIWQWTPFVTVLFFSGIIVQPVELYEVAAVDGANRWKIFRYITLPLLRHIILVTTIIRTVDILKIFEIPFVLTQGGPGNATEVMSIFIYRQGFQFWEITYASAASFIMLVVIIVLVNMYFRISKIEQ